VVTCVAVVVSACEGTQLIDPLDNSPPQICYISHQNEAQTIASGLDGRPQLLTHEQCGKKISEIAKADQEAQHLVLQERTGRAQSNEAQQEQSSVVMQSLRDEEARGYKHIAVGDLYPDGKAYAAMKSKVAISGFYKKRGRSDERLYGSYDDLMAHTFQSVEAEYVGLLTENANPDLREYLQGCSKQGGCNVTILGHIVSCVETNVRTAAAHDFCLVAEEIRSE
jgi:hypothetical protein